MIDGASLQCAVRPSVLLTAFLFFMHLLSFVILLPVLSLPWQGRAGLALVLAGSLAHCFRQFWKPRVTRLVAGSDGSLRIDLADGSELCEVRVLSQSLVLPWLVILCFRRSNGRLAQSLVLPSDALIPADSHRLLRRWLRCQLQSSSSRSRA